MFSVNLTLNSKPVQIIVKTLSPTNHSDPIDSLDTVLQAKRFESTYVRSRETTVRRSINQDLFEASTFLPSLQHTRMSQDASNYSLLLDSKYQPFGSFKVDSNTYNFRAQYLSGAKEPRQSYIDKTISINSRKVLNHIVKPTPISIQPMTIVQDYSQQSPIKSPHMFVVRITRSKQQQRLQQTTNIEEPDTQQSKDTDLDQTFEYLPKSTYNSQPKELTQESNLMKSVRRLSKPRQLNVSQSIDKQGSQVMDQYLPILTSLNKKVKLNTTAKKNLLIGLSRQEQQNLPLTNNRYLSPASNSKFYLDNSFRFSNNKDRQLKNYLNQLDHQVSRNLT